SAAGAVWVQAGKTVFRFENGKRSREWNFDLQSSQIRELQEDKDGWLSLMLDYAWIKISPDGMQSVTNATRPISAGWWLCGRLASVPDSLWVGGIGFLELITKGESKHIPR